MKDTNTKGQDKILAILGGLDHASALACDNRRNKSRLPFRYDFRIVLLASTGDAQLTIYTRNISSSGLGFLSRRPFEIGERFVLPIKMTGIPHKLVLCRVTFSRYVSAGLYSVGSEFEKSVLYPSDEAAIPLEWRELTLINHHA